MIRELYSFVFDLTEKKGLVFGVGGRPAIPPDHWNSSPEYLRPGRLTWNLQITHLERKMIFQTSIIVFHVNLPGVVICFPWCFRLCHNTKKSSVQLPTAAFSKKKQTRFFFSPQNWCFQTPMFAESEGCGLVYELPCAARCRFVSWWNPVAWLRVCLHKWIFAWSLTKCKIWIFKHVMAPWASRDVWLGDFLVLAFHDCSIWT